MSFIFKKIPQKKYYFSAKLLDVEVYYMLIVLISCHFGVTCMSTRHETNHGVILSRNTLARVVQMPSKKRRGRVRVVCNGKAEEAEKSFSSD